MIARFSVFLLTSFQLVTIGLARDYTWPRHLNEISGKTCYLPGLISVKKLKAALLTPKNTGLFDSGLVQEVIVNHCIVPANMGPKDKWKINYDLALTIKLTKKGQKIYGGIITKDYNHYHFLSCRLRFNSSKTRIFIHCGLMTDTKYNTKNGFAKDFSLDRFTTPIRRKFNDYYIRKCKRACPGIYYLKVSTISLKYSQVRP